MINFDKLTLHVRLSLLNDHRNLWWLSVAEPLFSIINRQRELLNQLENEEGSEDRYWEEVGNTEEIIGMLMVCCQTAFQRCLSEVAEWSTPRLEVGQLWKLGSCFDNGHSKAELINALANYYKHEGEWDKAAVMNALASGGPAPKDLKRQVRIAKVIRDCKIDMASNKVLYDGANLLLGDQVVPDSLGEIFAAWHDNLKCRLGLDDVG